MKKYIIILAVLYRYLDCGDLKPRNPKTSRYYQCVSDHFEMLESVWEERYERQYGFWRPWIKNVIYQG
jgi:hypothetical protein